MAVNSIEQIQLSKFFLNNANLIVIVYDKKGETVFVSSASESILGYKKEELLGDQLWNKLYSFSGDFSSVKNKIIEALTFGKEIESEPYYGKLKCKDGSYKWIQWRDSLGDNDTYISIGVDITDSRKSESLLIQADSILNCLSSLIIVSDNAGKVIFASPSIEKMLGYQPEQIMGDKWWEVTYDNVKDGFQVRDAILDSIFHDREIFIDITKQKIKTSKGDFKWVKWERIKGVDKGYVSIGTDITNNVLTEIKLIETKGIAVESLKIKNQIMANMSHEIRTPLNAVIGFTDLLLETKLTSEQRDHLDTMRKSGDILLSLINNVLNLSMLESGKSVVEEISFDLIKCVNDIVELLALSAEDKKLVLNLEIDSAIPKYVIGDRTRLEQILFNLIGNAIKFTDMGAVTVVMKQVKNISDSCFIYIEVRDTGIGILSNKINTIFDAFKQAQSDTSRIFGGTGLGLSIVKELVNLLKGSIEVESVFGTGSVFKLTLPFKKDLSKTGAKEKTQNVSMDAPLSLNILLVEDNKTNQLLAKTRLERWKCSVDIANNGIEGVKMVQKNIYDLVLMDIQMPIMDGYEATRIIKNDISEQVSKVPIIAMTAFTSDADIKKAMSAGMDDYVHKPFKPERLYQLLKEYGAIEKITKVENTEEKVEVKNDSDLPYVNLDFLRKETLNESAIIIMLMELFLSDIDEYVTTIDNELKCKNWNNLYRATHKIKPSISIFGIKKLEKVIYTLEVNLKEEIDLDKSSEQLIYCRTTLKLVKKEILNELMLLKE